MVPLAALQTAAVAPNVTPCVRSLTFNESMLKFGTNRARFMAEKVATEKFADALAALMRFQQLF